MRNFCRFIVSVATLTAIAEPALADAVEEIVVTANRIEQKLSRVGQSITVIDREELTRRQSDVLSDLLRTVPGVAIARNGGVGSVTSVFIRGAESDQTVALIDGIKLNDPSAPGGGFNFGNLLTGNVDRIEILRGSQSVLWGSQAIGGVINVLTQRPTEKLSLNLRSEVGSYGTGNVVGNVSGAIGALKASGGAGYFSTDGVSSFNSARGGKEADGYRQIGANGALELTVSKYLSLDARGWYADSKVGVDGFAPPTYSFGDTKEVDYTKQFTAYLGAKATFFDGRFKNRIGIADTDTRRRYIDPGSSPRETYRAKGTNGRIDYQGVVEIADGWQSTFGAEHETSDFRSSSFGGAPNVGRAQLDSGYAQIVATPIKQITMTAGVRHDEHDRFGGATTVGASALWAVSETGTTFRASYSEGFKAPSLYQLLGDYGNLTLRPETSDGFDVGATQAFLNQRVEIGLTYFDRQSVNLIDFVSCSRPLVGICTNRPFGTYNNIGRASATGVDATLTVTPIDQLRAQLSFSSLDATNRTLGSANFGRDLARRPSFNAAALVDYTFANGMGAGVTMAQVGSSFDNASNSIKNKSYTLVDVRAAIPVGHGVELFARVENLFDKRYEAVYQYGTLGRAGYVGLRYGY
jgi:vitamin B12 transporter